MKFSLLLVSALASGILPSLALRLPVERRTVTSRAFTVSVQHQNKGQLGLVNAKNNTYLTNITLGGVEITVNVDTGSTDLWVTPHPDMVSVNSTNFGPLVEAYGMGVAVGNISSAPFKLGSYEVLSQAFVNATQTQGFNESLFGNGGQGIIGFAFNVPYLSPIEGYLLNATNSSASSYNPITNIFAQDPSLPNVLSVQLNRLYDEGAPADGVFTIGEYVEPYESVQKKPHLVQFIPKGAGPRWSILMENMTVNGTPMKLNSSAPDAPKGKAVVVLDTGAAMPQIPSSIAGSIYKNIPGAFFADEPGLWIVPCNTTANITLGFAGQEYPIHPLDVTQVLSDTASDGTQFSFCVGLWQPFSLDPINFGGFDMLLGDAFLRNVYTAYNYGNISKEGKPTATPYIQLLSTVNVSEAAHDFEVSRKKQLSQMPPEAPASKLPCLLELSSCNSTSNSTTHGR